MPGLSFVDSAHPEGQSPRFSKALDAVRFDDRYTVELLLQRNQRQLAVTAYPAYPVEVIETRRYWMFLEGYLYNRTAAERQGTLSALAAKALHANLKSLRNHLTQLDGEFVAFFFDKQTETWAVINDILGRLPLYHWTAHDTFYLSREFRLFTHLSNRPPFDRLGMAQQLMFSYPLGTRTLLAGVQRLSPGTLVRSSVTASPDIIPLNPLNLENRTHAQRSLRENARALATRFKTSCEVRGQQAPHSVVALSGGLDSRAVALGLQHAGQSFETVTFSRYDRSNQRDVEGADALAKQFSFDSHMISLGPTTGHHLIQLLRAKGGLNLFDLGYVAQFLERILSQYGESIHLFTGDGGLGPRDLRPERTISDINSLTHQLLRLCWFSPSLVSQLTGLSKRTLTDSIHHRLHTYPETDPEQQYIHFLYERVYKFAFEGEDRNRHYFWSSAPLLSWPFVQYAINCPDEQKADFQLYRAFLQELDPHSLDVGYSDFLGIKMSPLRYKLYAFARSVVRSIPLLKRILHRFLNRHRTYSSDAPALQSMRRQIAQCPEIADYFDPDVLNHILEQSGDHSRHHVDGLFTLLSTIEAQYGSSSLKDYCDTPMRF